MFCPKCKSLMYPEGDYFICRKCGYKMEKKGKNIVVTKQKKKEITIIEDADKLNVLPKTNVVCPKYGNNEAYWVLRQMRGSDEPESRFYTCTKCCYKWREGEKVELEKTFTGIIINNESNLLCHYHL
ncbi:MAG TPA: transcription factor S [Thermoplasmatales archaeon]|nr:transcription factor S [Thermoplasmatales archaeon]